MGAPGAAVVAGAAPAAGGAADAGAAEAEPEKEEEPEEVDLGGGMDMFGGGDDCTLLPPRACARAALSGAARRMRPAARLSPRQAGGGGRAPRAARAPRPLSGRWTAAAGTAALAGARTTAAAPCRQECRKPQHGRRAAEAPLPPMPSCPAVANALSLAPSFPCSQIKCSRTVTVQMGETKGVIVISRALRAPGASPAPAAPRAPRRRRCSPGTPHAPRCAPCPARAARPTRTAEQGEGSGEWRGEAASERRRAMLTRRPRGSRRATPGPPAGARAAR